MGERQHLYLEIEEIYLDAAPGTDWDEVQRTRVPPTRVAPSAACADKGLELLRALGWQDVHLLSQGWDDHPQTGSVWSMSVEGLAPNSWSGNTMFWNPRNGIACEAKRHGTCVDPACTCGCHR